MHNIFKILKAASTNNNQVLHEKAITKFDTRWCSISRYWGGANLLQKCSKFFFPNNLSFWIQKFSFSNDPVILDLKHQ